MLSISCPNPSHQSLSSDHPTSSNLSNHPSITTSQHQLATHQFLFHHHFAKSTLDPSILIPSPLRKINSRPINSYSITTSYPHASLNILQSIACLLAMSNPTPNPSQLSSFELHSLSNNSPFLTRFLSFSFETHTTFLRSTSLLPFQFSIQSLSSLSRNSTSPASIPHLPSPLLTSACLRSRHLCLFSL